MITLYRSPAGSPAADEAARVLADLVIAHTVHHVDQVPDDVPAASGLPVIVDDGRVVTADEIPAYLEELTDYLAEWSRYQSDSCYVDKDDRFC